jgi:hypothetical protein
MNIEQLRSTINSTHSRMFVVRFIKQDGSERTMYAKTGLKRYLSKKVNKRKVQRNNNDVVCVFDMESKSYKSFRLSSVTEFRCKRIILK